MSSENNISLLINNNFNLQDRIDFMNKIWTPDVKYNFPLKTFGGKNLKFKLNWLQRWKWLSYSKIRNGAFCKFCVIFSQKEGGIGNQNLRMLNPMEFSNWKHAIEKFNHYEVTGYHKTCIDNYKIICEKTLSQ